MNCPECGHHRDRHATIGCLVRIDASEDCGCPMSRTEVVNYPASDGYDVDPGVVS